MNNTRNKSFKIGITVFVIILAYAVWNGRNLILGPSLKVLSPFPGEEISGNPVTVRGLAKNVSFISLNNKQIFVDKSGHFSEEVLLLPGINIIHINGKDRFGKEKVLSLELYK